MSIEHDQEKSPQREMPSWTALQVLEAADTDAHHIPLRVRDMLRSYAGTLERNAERANLPDEVINRSVFATIVSCMESDNGCEFTIERGDFTRAMQSIGDLRAAGFFADDPNDLDSDYWYACGGADEEDAKEHFSRVAEAYAPLNEVLQDIFDRQPPTAEGARVPDAQPKDHPDTPRLDWLERHPRLAEFVVDGQVTDCYLYAVSGAPGLKLREIIDAAMRAEPSKPEGA